MIPVMLLSIGVKLLIIAVIAVVLGYLTFIIVMGWNVFRFASKRIEKTMELDATQVPEEELAWYETIEQKRQALFRRPHDVVEIERDGIKMIGYYFPLSDAERAEDRPLLGGCAVLAHGWRDTRRQRSVDALTYLDAGCAAFVPVCRGHAPSEGPRIDLGGLHRRDFYAWMEQIRALDPTIDFFVLDGYSMGAATVLQMSGDADLPRDVAAVIADSPYTSYIDEGKWLTRTMKPWIRTPALFFTMLFFRTVMGYRLSDATPLDQVRHASVPTMIIHGKKDDFVPTDMGIALYEASSADPKELWLVDGAKHVLAVAVAGDEYPARKHAFIRRASERR